MTDLGHLQMKTHEHAYLRPYLRLSVRVTARASVRASVYTSMFYVVSVWLGVCMCMYVLRCTNVSENYEVDSGSDAMRSP